MLNLKRDYVLVTLFVVMASFGLRAEIAEVTINGRTIAPVLYEGYSMMRMLPDQRCPPVSDNFIRDEIINRALLVFDAEDKGLSLNERDVGNIEEHRKELEYLGPDGNKTAIIKASYLQFSYTWGGYQHHYPINVTHNQILDKYKQLINDKDPRLTNVLLVRVSPLKFDFVENAKKAKDLLTSGQTLEEVAALFEGEYLNVYHYKHWRPAYSLNYEFDKDLIRPESIVEIDDTTLLYFHKLKHRHRLRPFEKIADSDNYVYKIVQGDLRREQWRARDLALWEAADVRQNGELISKASEYKSCL